MSKDKQVQQDTQSKTRVNKPVQEEMRRKETAVLNPIPALQRAHTDPRTLSSADAHALQRTIGNQALGRLTIQRKMTVGPVGDKYEQEADAVAKQVVGKLNASSPQNAPAETAQRQEDEEELQMKPLPEISSLQRQEDEEELQMKPLVQRQEDEEELQMKPLPEISSLQRQEDEEELQMKPLVQRQEEEEELQMKPLVQRQEDEEELQMKPLAQRQEEEEELQAKSETTKSETAKGDPMLAGGELGSDVESSVQSAKSGGQTMPDAVRAPMENAFNTDFSRVKLHTDSTADSLNRSLSARAFTSGQDVFFRSGEYNPGSAGGQELLAHELTHTIQQSNQTIKRQGSKPESSLSSVPFPQIQRAWDVTAIEKANPQPFAALLKKMHEISTIGRSILGRLAAKTDSPAQLDKLVSRIPPLELETHLTNFPHPALIQRIVYLCPGSGRFNSIMNNIMSLNISAEIVTLLTDNQDAGLTEIDSVIDTGREAEGLKAANGTILQKLTVANFSGEHKTAVQDALDALDGVKARDWGGVWGDGHGNNEGNLPGIAMHGGYTEYYVRKNPKDSGWGKRRMVVHNATARVYYSWTHYGDAGLPAFVRIR